MRLLIVEDNLDIQANIADYLQHSFTLDFAYNGDQGLELALANEYDVIVLDLTLPGRDGLAVCEAYRRAAGMRAPIIMLTARDTMDDKEAGFAAGADDYLVKPFSLRELRMRIEALTRRPKVKVGGQLTYGSLSLDSRAAVACVGEKSATLHDKECKILALLIEDAPQIVPTDSLSYALWGDEPPDSGALRTHIYNLRQALSRLGLPTLLKTVRGRGYALRGEE